MFYSWCYNNPRIFCIAFYAFLGLVHLLIVGKGPPRSQTEQTNTSVYSGWMMGTGGKRGMFRPLTFYVQIIKGKSVLKVHFLKEMSHTNPTTGSDINKSAEQTEDQLH